MIAYCRSLEATSLLGTLEVRQMITSVIAQLGFRRVAPAFALAVVTRRGLQ
jgi:hypothetical protein